MARLVPHKGQDVALRACAAVVREHPTLRYLIVGEGNHEAALRRLAQDVGIADRVAFVGSLDDNEVAEAYATSDVYLGLSRQVGVDIEGFGISFIEASASGVPVIAGDSGGVRSAVRDGETGILCRLTTSTPSPRHSVRSWRIRSGVMRWAAPDGARWKLTSIGIASRENGCIRRARRARRGARLTVKLTHRVEMFALRVLVATLAKLPLHTVRRFGDALAGSRTGRSVSGAAWWSDKSRPHSPDSNPMRSSGLHVRRTLTSAGSSRK